MKHVGRLHIVVSLYEASLGLFSFKPRPKTGRRRLILSLKNLSCKNVLVFGAIEKRLTLWTGKSMSTNLTRARGGMMNGSG